MEVSGFRLQGSFDHRGYLYAARDGLLDDYTLEIFQHSVRRGATVVDVGANLGLFTLVAARAAGPTGQVVAFEPEENTCTYLLKNIHANGVEKVATVRQTALSDSAGKRSFARHGADPSQSGFVARALEDSISDVTVERGDETLRHLSGIDVLKIDVEGAEPEVLRGLAETIDRSPRVTVVCEINPSALDRCGHSTSELLETLVDLAFDVSVIDEPQRRLVPIAGTDGFFDPYANLFCTKRR
ncbi:MAG: FkbM family methyltransferase [Acidimicrobiia bacterium]|nr:FkbM family methyltransferase [Acidimicrobiia bacterium]